MQRLVEGPILTQLETLLTTLSNVSQRDDAKLKALQEINEHFEALTATSAYPLLMDNLLKTFIRILQTETMPQFIGENNTQQLRKLMLEMIHRMPLNSEQWKQYVKAVLSLMFKLMEVENEENCLVCLRIIIEFHKQFRPAFSHDIQQFLGYVKRVFSNLPCNFNNVFESRPQLKVKEIQELNVEVALQTAFVVTSIHTDQKLPDGSGVAYTLLPRGTQSLKVLAELPISIILFHQVYKQSVQQDMLEFIPLIMNCLSWMPDQQRNDDSNFNREILIDFLAIQVKAASFFAVLCRTMPDCMANVAGSLVKAVTNILHVCPPEVSSIRKDLMVAFRHLLATDLRTKFIASLNQFFDDKLMLGTSFTAQENLRAISYSTIADLVHHSRNSLSLQNQSASVHYFSRVVFDPTLPCTVHNMSVKLLLNLIEGICKQPDASMVKEMIAYMLDIFVRKFKEFATDILPTLFDKCERRRSDSISQPTNEGTTIAAVVVKQSTAGDGTSCAPVATSSSMNDTQSSLFSDSETKENENVAEQKPFVMMSSGEKEDKLPFATPTPSYVPSVNDARNLVKMLVYGAKTISWGLSGCRFSTQDPNYQAIMLSPLECARFVKIVKYGLIALDVYTIIPGNSPNTYQRAHATAGVRSKEEKEVMDHFAGIFTLMNLQTFKEIFTTSIDYLVERIGDNHALQLIPNSFLAGNVNTSATFGAILINYLVKRMSLMGSNPELSNLYLKLFKLVYGSVSVFPADNELMLRPYLHKLVNDCVELAICTKEPYNYLLLLRGLFRSIGGGSHDVLYQEFLPVLPGLLKNLNGLQSEYHQASIRELIVELCLTVPVRLSSLVPHIPMLMEPLVLALNGTPPLVLQGLRTLELCIDNLQPEFLHEHMGSVRSNLMHALWNIVCNSGNEQAAQTAWRTVGKLGGLNRKVLTDKQKVEFSEIGVSNGPKAQFLFFNENGNEFKLEMNILKAVQIAFTTIKKSSSDVRQRISALKLLNSFLLSLCRPANVTQLPNETTVIQRFENVDIIGSGCVYQCTDKIRREICVDALAGLLYAAISKDKDTRQEALGMVNSLVRHLTFLAVCEQIGRENVREFSFYKLNLMDTGVLIDAITKTLADEDKESCKAGILAITLVFDTAAGLLKRKDKVCQLSFVQCLCRKVAQLAYQSAWYGKLGGCAGIKFILENLPPSWTMQNVSMFFSALVFVVQELSVEIANGTVEFAKNTIEVLLKVVASLEDDAILENAYKTILSFVVRQLSSPFAAMRDLAVYVLETLGKILNRPIGSLLELQIKNLLQWLNFDDVSLTHLSPQCQIGSLEAVAYVCSKDASVNVFDPSRELEQKFFDVLVAVLDAEKFSNLNLNISDKEIESLLVKLKQSVLRAILGYKKSSKHADQLFTAIFKCLTGDNKEIQETAYDTMNILSKAAPPMPETLHSLMKPLLIQLNNINGLTLAVVNKLLLLTKLFPTSFAEKFSDQLATHLNKWLEIASQNSLAKPNLSFMNTEMEICAVIIEIFQYVPSATPRFVDYLIPSLTKAEISLQIGPGSPWRKPLLQFLIRYPSHTVEYFFLENNLKETHMCNYMLWMMKQEEAKGCREILQTNPLFLANLMTGNLLVQPAQPFQMSTQISKEKLEALALHLIRILAKRDPTWLMKNPQIVQYVRQLWNNPEFRDRSNQESFDKTKVRASLCALKILLLYFQSDTSQIDVLFDILYCFLWKMAVDLSFLRKFLDKELSQNFTVGWKRQAFFKFVEVYSNQSVDPRYKTMILQYVIIPCVARSFEKGETEQLIGGPALPEVESDDNLVSLFLNKVIINNADPSKLNTMHDVLVICLYQLTSLFVEYASSHIHDGSKKQGARLRTVMTFGWPCLQQSTYLDPIAKYYGHLLIAHIINKFAINRKIVLQVFLSLLKAHGQETRLVVRQALNLLTPAVPLRMEDGHVQLAGLIKKTFIEEGYSSQQVVHLLQLLTRHYKTFYPVRHQLMQYIIPAMQKVALQSQGAVENRRLAVDVCEMIVKWEMIRIKGDVELNEILQNDNSNSSSSATATVAGESRVAFDEISKPFEKGHIDSVVNFLVRLACSPQDQSQTNTPGGASTSGASPTAATAEALCKRCLLLVKVVLKPDMWGLTAELKIQWIEKALLNIDQAQNVNAVCVCLDVLAFVIGALPSNLVLPLIRPIQRGLVSCLNSSHSQMVKSMYNFITKLLVIFSSDSNNPISLDELDLLNNRIQQILTETLSNYEKMPNANINSLGGALMLLKALCNSNSLFVDRIAPVLVKAMQKLSKDFASPVITDAVKSGSDMLLLCLDLIRSRVENINPDVRKQFVTGVLCVILDKSTNPKLITSVIKLVDDWMKNAATSVVGISASYRERQTMLMRILQCIEKKFSLDHEVTKIFLELTFTVFKSEQFRGSELITHLHGALVMGLSCSDAMLREKYCAMFNEMVPKSPFDRLFYIMCSLRWDFVSQHYWIKQCIDLTLSIIDQSQSLRINGTPSFTDLSTVGHEFVGARHLTPLFRRRSTCDESMVWEEDSNRQSFDESTSSKKQISNLWQKELQLLQSSAALRASDFLPHFVQLCHCNSDLAELVWLDLFPALWDCLTETEKSKLTNEIIPFLSSKYHSKQTEAHPSVLKTFVEAFSLCSSQIFIKPQLLRYLGKSHALWHKSILLLEQAGVPLGQMRFDGVDEEKYETLESLADLYSALNEMDMWTFTWTKRNRFPETNVVLALSQQGIYSQAVDYLEKAMAKEQAELTSIGINLNVFSEFRLWENEWVRCMEELNQWDAVKDFAAVKSVNDPFLLLESAWRIPSWPLMKEAIYQIEHACPNNFLWKLQLYRGYFTLCGGDEQHVGPAVVERIAEVANQSLIKEWRKLPKIIGKSHVPLLQAAQQVVELTEAAHLTNTLLPANINRPTNITDMKSIVKTWRNRSPTASDSLSHWSQIFCWRLYHYQNLITCLENDPQSSQNAVLGVHAFAQCLLQFSRAARRQGANAVAVDALNRLHTIPNLPVIDGFQKLREQIKCCVKMAGATSKPGETQQFLHDAIDVIENTNISYFAKETTGEFYALKGVVLSKLDRNDEAAQVFSASLQMSDASCRPWGYWGEHLENVFLKDKQKSTAHGVNAVVCYLQATRLCTHEWKAKKYISRILWLLKYDLEPWPLHESLIKYTNLMAPVFWVSWIPQLLAHLKETCQQPVADLLIRIGKAFPEALFYSFKFFDMSSPSSSTFHVVEDSSIGHESFAATSSASASRSSIVRRRSKSVEFSTAVEPWQKCLRDLHTAVRDLHPFLFATLSKTCSELIDLYPRHWSATSLRIVRLMLNECYKCAFEKRNDQHLPVVPPTTIQKLKFVQEMLSDASKTDTDVLALLKSFETDFELAAPPTVRRVQPFLSKLINWYKAFEAKIALLPKRDLLPEVSLHLSSFASKSVVVDVPSEIFSCKQPIHFRLKIVKFLPKVETVHRGNWLCKRIWIRGTNGKKFTFLIVNLNDLASDALKFCRLLQFQRILNCILAKNKECASRLLQFNVPTLIPIGSNSILISDEPSSMCLLDFLKETSNSTQISPDDFIVRYYEKLTIQQSRGQVAHHNLRDILKDMQTTMLPKSSLTYYFQTLYTNAESYFTVRKQFCLHLALLNLSEFCFHLTTLGPEQFCFDKESGFVSPTFVRLDINENTGELESSRPVQFRLTPCLVDFLGFGLNGQLAPAMIAAARCFNAQNLQLWLRVLVYDECLEWATSRNRNGHEDNCVKVLKAVVAVASRIQSLANFDNAESKVNTLLAAAQSLDNLCRMEPVWHPWL